MGNFILRKHVFNTEEKTDCYMAVRGQLDDKEILLINPPDHLHLDISEEKLTKFKKTCVRLIDPGPHVFLLVIQPGGFTNAHKQRLLSILESFSNQCYKHSLALISTPKKRSSKSLDMYMEHPSIGALIEKCRHSMLWHENLQLSDLSTTMYDVVKENRGHNNYFFEDASSQRSMAQGAKGRISLDPVKAAGRLCII